MDATGSNREDAAGSPQLHRTPESMTDPNGWRSIESDTEAVDKCLLWCSDEQLNGEPQGVVMGRVYRYSNGDVAAQGVGYSGDWTYTHWQPLPAPPAQEGR